MTAADLGTACENHFPGDYPAVLPWLVQVAGDGSRTAFYWCPEPGCGNRWSCDWDAGAVGWPVSRSEAAVRGGSEAGRGAVGIDLDGDSLGAAVRNRFGQGDLLAEAS